MGKGSDVIHGCCLVLTHSNKKKFKNLSYFLYFFLLLKIVDSLNNECILRTKVVFNGAGLGAVLSNLSINYLLNET